MNARPPSRAELLAGPWRWPAEGDEAGLARARALTGLAAPPAPRRGVAPLLAVNDDCATLWALKTDDGFPGLHVAAFRDAPLAEWAGLGAALSRTLPLLWRPLDRLREIVPRAALLAIVARRPEFVPTAPAALDDRSFGLSLLLANASVALDAPLAPDIAASATIGDDGAAGPVDERGLARKIELLLAAAPRVRRLVVAHENAAAARAAADGRLEIVAAAHGVDALRAAFGEDLEELLLAAGRDDESRARLVESFFALALSRRDAVPDWTPVRRAADAALRRWQDLGDVERARLRFAEAVAARHEANEGAFPWPDDVLLGVLPREPRLELCAHIVQQSADAGFPPADEAEARARVLIGVRFDRSRGQLRLLGALARLLAVVGRPREALALQREAAEEFASMPEDGRREISFPLSAWFRLSGVLQDNDAFDDAERLLRDVSRRGALAGEPYIALARATALFRLARTAGPDPEATLLRLAADTKCESHLRWSAARFAIALLRRAGRDEEAAAIKRVVRAGACECSDSGDDTSREGVAPSANTEAQDAADSETRRRLVPLSDILTA
ncbi:MAG: hypothetical protein ABFD84_15925, partial [Candidatus Polarisedimenticolia bacterium]